MPMSPMPGRSVGSPQEEGDEFSSLVPTSGEGESDSQPDEERMNVGRQIRQMISQITAIAKQYPEFAEAAESAAQALTKGSVQIAGNQRGPGKAGAPPNA